MRPALGLAGGEHSSPPARAFRGRVVEGRAMGWGSEVGHGPRPQHGAGGTAHLPVLDRSSWSGSSGEARRWAPGSMGGDKETGRAAGARPPASARRRDTGGRRQDSEGPRNLGWGTAPGPSTAPGAQPTYPSSTGLRGLEVRVRQGDGLQARWAGTRKQVERQEHGRRLLHGAGTQLPHHPTRPRMHVVWKFGRRGGWAGTRKQVERQEHGRRLLHGRHRSSMHVLRGGEHRRHQDRGPAARSCRLGRSSRLGAAAPKVAALGGRPRTLGRGRVF